MFSLGTDFINMCQDVVTTAEDERKVTVCRILRMTQTLRWKHFSWGWLSTRDGIQAGREKDCALKQLRMPSGQCLTVVTELRLSLDSLAKWEFHLLGHTPGSRAIQSMLLKFLVTLKSPKLRIKKSFWLVSTVELVFHTVRSPRTWLAGLDLLLWLHWSLWQSLLAPLIFYFYVHT